MKPLPIDAEIIAKISVQAACIADNAQTLARGGIKEGWIVFDCGSELPELLAASDLKTVRQRIARVFEVIETIRAEVPAISDATWPDFGRRESLKHIESCATEIKKALIEEYGDAKTEIQKANAA